MTSNKITVIGGTVKDDKFDALFISNDIASSGTLFSVGIVQRQLAEILDLKKLNAEFEKRGEAALFFVNPEIPMSEILTINDDGSVIVSKIAKDSMFCVKATIKVEFDAEKDGYNAMTDVVVGCDDLLDPQYKRYAEMFVEASHNHVGEIVSKGSEIGADTIFIGNAFVSGETLNEGTIVGNVEMRSQIKGLTPEITEAIIKRREVLGKRGDEAMKEDTGIDMDELAAEMSLAETEGPKDPSEIN